MKAAEKILDPSENQLDAELLRNFYYRGIIPGPSESELSFLERAEELNPVKNSLMAYLKNNFPQPIPDWASVHFHNKGLFPWQGGCTLIDRKVIIQLRKEFKNRKKYLSYEREEILIHESIHALRMAFNEPIFEEILAYKTSSSKFRRYFGPIFRTSRESVIFLSFLILLNSLIFLYPITAWVFSLLTGCIGYGLYRLSKFQNIYNRCLKKLTALLQEKTDAKSLMISLTDDEIILFSKLTINEIREFIQNGANNSLRWKQLESVYKMLMT
jgi:hypothetical protein